MEIRLNWLLSRFLRAPEKLPQPMRCVLHVAVYALLFLEGMPAYAAVDWAVARVKRTYGQTLAKVANGCLRTIGREGVAPQAYAYYYAPLQDALAQQSLFYSVPLWIVRLWHKGYGTDKAVLLSAKSANRPAAGLRVNILRPNWKDVARQLENAGAQRMAAACFAITPKKRARIEAQCSLAAFLGEGKVSRQGVASQLALDALHPAAWPDPIWDACAGQGTKSCALLELGKNVSVVSDTHLRRLFRVADECRRLNLPPPLIVQASALRPPLHTQAGTIVLDAPCSGLGVLASRPDIRRHRTEEDVQMLVRRQAAMLDAAHDSLGTGGHLAYITCTQNPDENELQVRAFLRRHPRAELAFEWNSPAQNMLLEGMYAALLVKR